MGELVSYESPLKRWPGKVYTNAYMKFPELVQWEAAMKKLQAGGATDLSLIGEALLPMACVAIKKWEIEGLPEAMTPEEFPGSADFARWITEVLNALFTNTNDIAPESPGPSTTV